MFGGGRGTPPYEDDDHGMGGFRGEDSGAGAEDALAMGMDVDIPPASLAGDRREAERRRGREGRYTAAQMSSLILKLIVDPPPAVGEMDLPPIPGGGGMLHPSWHIDAGWLSQAASITQACREPSKGSTTWFGSSRLSVLHGGGLL